MNKPAVNPEIYNQEYYLHKEYGGGSGEEFLQGIIVQRFKDAFNYSNTMPDMKILDIGCGRGEMAYLCALNGAQAVGVDYSLDAIKIAVSLKEKAPENIAKRLNFIHINGFRFPFENGTFDKIFLLDVAEHLSRDELLECLKETKRLLKNKGELIIDTSPNRLFNDFAYPLWEKPLNMAINKIFKKNLMTRPARTEYDKKVHINEQTIFSLRKYLKISGFRKTELLMHPRKVIPRKMPDNKTRLLESLRCIVTCLFPLSCFFPLNIIFCNDIIAKARK